MMFEFINLQLIAPNKDRKFPEKVVLSDDDLKAIYKEKDPKNTGSIKQQKCVEAL